MVTTLNKTLVPPRIAIDEINKTTGFTERVQQLKQRYLEAKPVVSGQRARYMAESYKETEGEHPAKRAAKAFANVMAKMKIAIWPGELLVGAVTPHFRGAHPRVETAPKAFMLRLNQEKIVTASLANEAQTTSEDKEDVRVAAEYWMKYWEARPVSRCLTDEEMKFEKAICDSRMMMGDFEGTDEGGIGGRMTTGITPGGDYARLLSKGFNGLIADARDHIARIKSKRFRDFTTDDTEKLENLEAMIIAMEGMICFSRRHAALAREMAATESDPQRKKELLKIADVCENVPANPARDFQEALQVSWLVLIGQELEKTAANAFIGRMDEYCWPYYENDIASRRITRQEAAELVGCLFIKWQQLEAMPMGGFVTLVPGSYLANLSLGGVNEHGKDASNELSCLLLHVAKQVKTNQPHISLLWHRTMAQELLDKAVECTRDHGAGIPAWFNHHHVVDYLIDRGYSHQEAREGAIVGCINIARQKDHTMRRIGVGGGFVNHPKLLEIALNDGIEPVTGVRFGPSTGDAKNFRTFDEVFEAYRKQYDHWVENRCGSVNAELTARRASTAAYIPFISSILDYCIERGKDANHGGEGSTEKLLGGTWVDRGLPDLCDSLTALKKVVFEGGVPMATMLDAMKANWQGYDELRRQCQAAPKWGNDDDEADSLMAGLWRYPIDKLKDRRDATGIRPIFFRQGAGWAQWAGKKTGALPNGRKAWTALADASASPVQGADVKGPTAVLNSVSKMDSMYLEGPLLNMRFAPGPLRSREGRQKFLDLITTYFDRGGFHVQFTILDRDTLLDAKKHPQKYRTLVVRVAGYSAFWVELTPEVQDEIITRTDHQL